MITQTRTSYRVDTPATFTPILEHAAHLFGTTPLQILSTSRTRVDVVARQAVMWVLRQRYPAWSYVALGALLNRDHTTVLYGVLQAEYRAVADPRYAWQLAELLGGQEVSRG